MTRRASSVCLSSKSNNSQSSHFFLKEVSARRVIPRRASFCMVASRRGIPAQVTRLVPGPNNGAKHSPLCSAFAVRRGRGENMAKPGLQQASDAKHSPLCSAFAVRRARGENVAKPRL